MLPVSVIICSHNPREDYLRRVLDALKAQTLPAKDWELLLVDNASKEPLAGRFDLSWHPNARHVREEKTGLTHARLCGIAEAKGDLLVFVDDDNVLRPDYLQACLKLSAARPHLGAFGGSCLPEFEIEPPSELRPWLHGLLVEKLSRSYEDKIPAGGPALPAGAGMAVRRAVAEHYREKVLRDPLRQSLDRTGKLLGGGGDSDLTLCSLAFDLSTGRFPELELTHLIPAHRLTLEYLEGIHDPKSHAPGQFQPSAPKAFLKRLALLSKNPVERRIRTAEARGRRAAQLELERRGFFNRPRSDF
jgi:hypothetical protein